MAAEPGQGDLCRVHDKEIDKVRERTHDLSGTVTALQHDLLALDARIPENLGQFMGAVDTKLGALARGQDDIIEALKRGYVTVAEFKPVEAAIAHAATQDNLQAVEKRLDSFALKTEVAPIQSAFWGLIKLGGIAFISSILALLGWTKLVH